MPVTAASLKQRLQAEPYRYDFVQVIRLMRLMAKSKSLHLSAEPMPQGGAGEVIAVEQLGTQQKIRLGLEALSGIKGVVPNYFYEELLARLHQDDQALEQFLDIFNHRYYQLLQGALEKGNLLIRDEQEQLESQGLIRPPLRECLRQLAALPGLTPGRLGGEVPADLLRYTVLLGLKARTLGGLRQLLRDYFSLQFHVRVVARNRIPLPPASLTRLGGAQAQNNRLGRGLLLGQHGDLPFQQLEILVEPRDRQEYLQLRADTDFAAQLRKLTQLYLRDGSEVKLYLYVRRALIARPQLSSDPRASVRLGESSCLEPNYKPHQMRKMQL